MLYYMSIVYNIEYTEYTIDNVYCIMYIVHCTEQNPQ